MKTLLPIYVIISLIANSVLGQPKTHTSNRVLDFGDIPICNRSGDQTSPAVASDGRGGFIVAWQDNRDGVSKIYAQRIDGHGAALWDQGGKRVCLDTTIQLLPRIVSDGVGGAIIEWQTDALAPVVGPYGPTFEEYTRDYSAQRISCEGELKWGNNGTVIFWVHRTYNSGSTSNFSYKKVNDIVTDGKGGVIVLFYDYQWRSTTSGDAFVLERIDSSGVVAWTGVGVGSGSHPFTLHNGRIVSDSLGGAYVSWLYVFQRVYPSTLNFNQLWIAHVDSLGSLLWRKLPVIDGSQSTVFDYGIADDREGGCYVTWGGASPNGVAGDVERDIFAQRFDYSGNLHWGQNGLLVCDAAGIQDEPTATPGPAGSAVIAWRDFRNGTLGDLYAARITSSGSLSWAGGGLRVTSADQLPIPDFSIETHFTDTTGVNISIPYSPSMNSNPESGNITLSLWYRPNSSVNSHRSMLFGRSEGNCRDDFIWSFFAADSDLFTLVIAKHALLRRRSICNILELRVLENRSHDWRMESS